MANSFVDVKQAAGIIAEAAAGLLSEKLQFCKTIAKADPKDFAGKNGYGAGDTIYISKPPIFKPQTSFDITSSIQDILEDKVALTADVISTIGIQVDSLEFAYELELKNFIKRVIDPAVTSMAHDIESRMITKATQAVANSVGTPGSTTFSIDDILSAREKMNRYLCPKDSNRYFLHDSAAGRKAVVERKGLFHSSSEIEKQYEQGFVGIADGFKWMESELLYVHTNGADVATGVEATVLNPATGATQVGMDGVATSAVIKKGSVFTIDNVYAVHPQTKTTYSGMLQQFVVTADANESSGTAIVSISPTIYSSASGSLQNVSALHADEAACTFIGSASTSYTQNLAYHRDAFRMVSLPLIMPKSAEYAEQRTVDGITVAIVRDFDIKTRRMITRLDFLGGLVADRPEWACRIWA